MTPGILRSLKDLESFRILATDGDIGKVYDLFFDDEYWAVRYLVEDTGHWLPGRKVLLPPSAMDNPRWHERCFSLPQSREKVKSSPDIDTAKPVSRQREIELHAHYGWPFYWTGTGVWPAPIMPFPPIEFRSDLAERAEGNPHLRSVREIVGYDVDASDRNIGIVEDFIADDEVWNIHYLVVATHKWLLGRRVLVDPEWIAGPIRWEDRTMKIVMSGDKVRKSPEFNSQVPLSREYENALYEYYGRPKYWLKPRWPSNHVI